MQAVISETEWVSSNAKAIRFIEPSGGVFSPAPPGSHIKVALSAEEKGSPFSLTSPPAGEPGYEVVVTQGAGAGAVSRWLLEEAGPGKAVEITRPRCGLPRAQEADHHVLVAGGMGVTAFLAHMAAFRTAGASYELHYAVRSRSEAIRLRELQSAHPGRVQCYPADEGFRLRVAERVRRAPAGSHFYVCGPPRLTQEVVDAAFEVGWPSESVHWDRFGWQPEEPRSGLAEGWARPVEA
ncbi:ferredoxin reductase [Thiohalorhabdus methylotrophus]|uniref:Ferredoxin reductase n=1 Tax=Thiohalorhabdus methylotrophus TaxID=3242694 RepID=A0ABV4TVT8_9GAMM